MFLILPFLKNRLKKKSVITEIKMYENTPDDLIHDFMPTVWQIIHWKPILVPLNLSKYSKGGFTKFLKGKIYPRTGCGCSCW